MREVDQALAHAYARRDAAPAAHGTTPEHAPVPPPPHLAPAAGPRPGPFSPPPVGLRWPALVLTLERQCGERFEALADALLEARDRRGLRTLLFTSCHRAEGRTSLVLGLARALARRPGRTLLMDADFGGPMLARQLDLRPEVGLDGVVESGAALADAILSAPDDNLSVLPLRAPVANPRGFAARPAWEETVGRLRREFDLVILDGSPLFTGLSVAPAPRGLDAAVLVHNPALTGRAALLRAREALAAGGLPLLGVAETFVS